MAGWCWSSRLDGKYIKEQHLSTAECYDFETAKAKCQEATDCHGIATQSDVCSGKYRVSHGSTATLETISDWKKVDLWAYTLDRSCLGELLCSSAIFAIALSTQQLPYCLRPCYLHHRI